MAVRRRRINTVLISGRNIWRRKATLYSSPTIAAAQDTARSSATPTWKTAAAAKSTTSPRARKYLVDAGLADPKRLAIGGGSHGGTMVAYAVTKYPTLFQAAIEMYGVVDRATFLERTNRNSAVRWAMKMGGSPAEKPDVYLRANSLLKVKSIQTPLLILHGENDPQVPPYESAQFVKRCGRTTKFSTTSRTRTNSMAFRSASTGLTRGRKSWRFSRSTSIRNTAPAIAR